MVHRVLRVFLFVVSAIAVGGFALVGATRAHLADPLEDELVSRAARIADGQPLYDQPTRSDAQAMMPGFPFLVSGLSRVFGAEPSAPRTVSMVVSFLIAAMVLLIIRLESTSWTPAISGGGFALMGIGLLGDPPGTCNPELPMLLLVLIGCFAIRHIRGSWGAVIGSVVLAIAFFIDQQAAWFLVAAGVAIAIEDRERLAVYTLIGGFVLGCGYVELSQFLGGWFNYEAWDVPLRALSASAVRPLHYIGDHLLGRLGVPTLAAVLTFAMPIQPWRGRSGIWTWVGVAGLIAGLAATQSTGFGPRSLIPSVVVMALLGPISIQRVTGHLSAWPGSTRLGGQSVVLAALTLQSIVFLSCLTHSGWLSGGPVPARPPVMTSTAATSAPPGSPFASGVGRNAGGTVSDPGSR